jgi:ATP-dependent DNA helicase RecG
MPVTILQFEQWLQSKEKENLEFKEAKNQYDFSTMMKYCCAIANERGGYFILGVTDKFPRVVVGTGAFKNFNHIKKNLLDAFHLRFEIEEYFYQGKRILIFTIPSRPIGVPISYDGRYWMRVNESLEIMTPDQIRNILNETQSDFSALPCENASIDDLSEIAIEIFRSLWSRKANNSAILKIPLTQLLKDAELLIDGKLNYASLILLGKTESLGRYLPNCEIVFEYRNSESSIESQQREDFRIGFFAVQSKLWDLINLRNEVQHVQDGLFIRDIPNFNEEVIREALLNAVTHRDYGLQGSVFIRQYPNLLEIENPGSFPAGVTPENILYKQNPRNRRIAEVFQKCGLVERSGQGADKMFRRSIEEAKPLPDYSRSDAFSVFLILQGKIQDVQFLKFFERVSEEKKVNWTVSDLILLELIRKGDHLDASQHDAVKRLVDQGFVELIGRGKGVRYILSKKFYTFLGEKGVYTRKKGLDKEEKKALILSHLKNHNQGTIQEFEQALPSLTRNQIHKLLKALKKEGKIEFKGSKKFGSWFSIESY